jgi:hypothetical protein
MEDFDYKSFQAKALEQLKAGKPLLGKDGAFAPTRTFDFPLHPLLPHKRCYGLFFFFLSP